MASPSIQQHGVLPANGHVLRTRKRRTLYTHEKSEWTQRGQERIRKATGRRSMIPGDPKGDDIMSLLNASFDQPGIRISGEARREVLYTLTRAVTQVTMASDRKEQRQLVSIGLTALGESPGVSAQIRSMSTVHSKDNVMAWSSHGHRVKSE